MLILTRKPDQGIVIAGTICVRVLAVDPGRVRLSVVAPDEVSVVHPSVEQEIVIAGTITVRILDARRDRVKIGVEAPGDVPVLRQELLGRASKNANGRR